MSSFFGLIKEIGTGRTRTENEIYSEVRLDNVLEGKTCTPISLHEFKLFLVHKERSVENLNFHFWYRDYITRWGQLSDAEKILSPPPVEGPGLKIYRYKHFDPKIDHPLQVSQHTEDYFSLVQGASPIARPPGTPGTPGAPGTGAPGTPETPSIAKKYANLNLNLDPKSQPFRNEIDAVLQTFFSYNSPKELNVDGHVSAYVQCHSKYTTHPDVFAQVDESVIQNMQASSLRSFLNHALENINYDGKIVRWSIACGLFTAFLLLNIVFFSMHFTRWWRIIGLPFAFFTVVYVVSAQAGVCFTRAMNKQRELHDYELLGMPSYIPNETEPVNEKSLDEWKKVIDPLVLKFNMVLVRRTFLLSGLANIILIAILVVIPI